jgi:hypothetical protein
MRSVTLSPGKIFRATLQALPIVTDPNLVNSWGLVINPTASIFWVADNGTGPEPPKRVSKIVYQNRRPLRLDRKMLINATVSAKTTVFEWDSIGFEEPVYEREGR